MFLFRDDEDRHAVPEAPVVAPPKVYRNPTPCVDIIIPNAHGQIALIKRKNPPHGWALPGGFVDEGESVEQAAIREAKEELGLDIVLEHLLGVYSDPARDPRQHNMSVVFVASLVDTQRLRAGDDAAEAIWGEPELWGDPARTKVVLVFDHSKIVKDYVLWRESHGVVDLRKSMLKQIASGHHRWQAYMDEEPTVEDIANCVRRIRKLVATDQVAAALANGKQHIQINFSVRTLQYVLDMLDLRDHLAAEPVTSTTSNLVFR